MEIGDAVKLLSEIDALETWSEHISSLNTSDKRKVYELAMPLWVKRMVENEKLLVHPDVLQQLKKQSWHVTDLQKRMIWASVIASAHGPDSKLRFNAIKEKLLKKYGRDWWEDVYKRVKNAWAAKERIQKKDINGPVVTALIKNTHLFSGIASEERDKALRMIPKL